jgi:type IV pilus assembly protein PilZ
VFSLSFELEKVTIMTESFNDNSNAQPSDGTQPIEAESVSDTNPADGVVPPAEIIQPGELGVSNAPAQAEVPEIEPITVSLKNADALYSAYMPFVKHGGLFIVTNNSPHQIGEEVLLQVELMDEPELYTVPGKVVWYTPLGAQGGMVAGIGIQFEGDTAESLRNKIETYLAGKLNSDKRTDTM